DKLIEIDVIISAFVRFYAAFMHRYTVFAFNKSNNSIKFINFICINFFNDFEHFILPLSLVVCFVSVIFLFLFGIFYIFFSFFFLFFIFCYFFYSLYF